MSRFRLRAPQRAAGEAWYEEGGHDTQRRRAVTDRVGRIWIRRIGSAYDVMFAPTGNGECRLPTEARLRILNVALTLERMSKLGL